MTLYHGGAAPEGKAETAVVAYCEAMLERARRGETVAVAAVEIAPNRIVSQGFANPRQEGQGHMLLSGLVTLTRRLDDELN